MDEASVMPRPVRTARILLWIDIALMVLGLLVLSPLIIAVLSGAPAAEAVLFLALAAFSTVLLVLTVILTIKLTSRRRWVWIGLLVVMGVNVIGYVANVFAGGGIGVGVISLALSIAILVCVLRPESGAYFNR